MKRARLLLAMFFCAISSFVYGDAFPDRPIRMIVAYSAGGTADILARELARHMSKTLGQPVIVENRAGGASIIATDLVAKSRPDGYTLLVTGTALASNVSLLKNVSYDPVKDFSCVTLVASAPLLLLANPSVPANTPRELIALAQAEPGRLSFASAGVGGGSHLAGELFKQSAKVDLLHAPYKGAAPAVTDLLAGRVSLMFETITNGLPYIKPPARLKVLGITSNVRSPLLPDVPTISESGVPGYEASSWYGVLAPGGTDPKIVRQLNAAMVLAIRDPEMRERLIALGGTPVANSPSECDEFVREEVQKWARVIKAAGIKPD